MERSDPMRITAFTDGVMAVAITLLVLNIEVPTVPEDQLASSLDDLITPLAAYALSFALVGRFWVVHHRLFEAVKRFDGPLMAMNLLFLALIAPGPVLDQSAERLLGGAGGGRRVRRHDRAGVAHQLGDGRLHAAQGLFVSIPAYISTGLSMALWVSAIFVRYPLRLVTGRGEETSS